MLVDSAVVEPVDPFQGCDLDLLEIAPGAAGFDQFGLVEAVDRLRESVVVAGASGPDRGVDAGIDEPFSERDRGVLGEFNRSLWWTTPVRSVIPSRCRVQIACSIASSTSGVVIEVEHRQPRMRRA